MGECGLVGIQVCIVLADEMAVLEEAEGAKRRVADGEEESHQRVEELIYEVEAIKTECDIRGGG